MSVQGRALAQSVAAAVCGYILALTLETALMRVVRPSEWELASVSDVVLAVALGIAVYLWRDLVTIRRGVEEHERADLVLQTQLSVAAEIQRRLLPRIPAAGNGFEWAAILRSAGKIGGDFYDFLEIAPRVWVTLVADVSGKGIPAAMALGLLRSDFRTFARQSSAPAQIVARLSAGFYEEFRGSLYVTCIVGTFDLAARTLTYANAGHPAGIVSGGTGTRYVNRGGPPAGLLPDVDFEQDLIELRLGDVCLLVTDGVTEALEGEMSLERELEMARARPGAGAAELCHEVITRALNGHGPRDILDWDDDRTVVVVTVSATRADAITPDDEESLDLIQRSRVRSAATARSPTKSADGQEPPTRHRPRPSCKDS